MKSLEDYQTPVFWAEGHPGDLNREDWQIEISGLCRKPGVFTWIDLVEFPKTTVDARLTSVTRWSVKGFWSGIKLSDILREVEMDSTVKFIRFWSVGLIYDTSIPVDIALKEKTLLAYEFNDQLLSEDYGGPIRVFCPYLWGYKSAKSVVKIELLNHYIPGFWEQRGYTDSGEIEAGKVIDLNDQGKVKKIPPGEVLDFQEDQ
ncbi:MAG: molybdopterin-dependent oxidoreductase [Candidatus Cloacimonetes bacterium]|nr:molybdopterin-dependent oxidoreductase [Candidatus Cloacimonadota bacterium]